MDKLVGIPICLIQNLITKYPIAMILIVAGLFIYYKGSRLLLKRMFRKETAKQQSDAKSGPAALYDAQVNFIRHAVEFLVALILLIALCTKVGLIQNFNEVMGPCLQIK